MTQPKHPSDARGAGGGTERFAPAAPPPPCRQGGLCRAPGWRYKSRAWSRGRKAGGSTLCCSQLSPSRAAGRGRQPGSVLSRGMPPPHRRPPVPHPRGDGAAGIPSPPQGTPPAGRGKPARGDASSVAVPSSRRVPSRALQRPLGHPEGRSPWSQDPRGCRADAGCGGEAPLQPCRAPNSTSLQDTVAPDGAGRLLKPCAAGGQGGKKNEAFWRGRFITSLKSQA